MGTRRQVILALGAGVLAAPLASFAQQRGKIWRIGFLSAQSRPPSLESHYIGGFPRGMRELGYVEGKNFVIEWRFADGKYELLANLAAELVRMKVDIIVTGGTAANRAVQQATTTIPVVNATMIDPVGNGFAASLARPGGNITGLSLTTTDLSPKHLELLKILLPKLTRVGALMNPGNPGHAAILKGLQANARQVGIKVLPVEARTAEEIERGFATMKKENAEAVIVAVDAFFIGQRQQLAELALKHRLPSIFSVAEHTQAGGLMSYGQDLADFYRRAAGYVERIFKGAKPGDLPIEQLATFTLVINGKTAKALGLTIPRELLLRAEKVIE